MFSSEQRLLGPTSVPSTDLVFKKNEYMYKQKLKRSFRDNHYQ